MRAPPVAVASTTTVASHERGDDPVADREAAPRGRHAEPVLAEHEAVAGGRVENSGRWRRG